MNDQLKKYAELAIKVGVNLQPGQHLVIGYGQRQVLPEHVEFVRLLIEAGYDAGAKFVQVDWGDEAWLRETVKRGSLETLEARAKWQAEWVQQLAKEGAAYIALPASNPDLYAGIDSDRVAKATRAIHGALREFNKKRTNDEYAWALLSAPTQDWANKVYPELPEGERVNALWRDILACARVFGDDPVAGWHEHLKNLEKRSAWLNGLGIKKLHYKSPVTDLYVELPEGHFFTSAMKKTPQGVAFVANIPTEEVYASPLKTGVNGVVTSTLPLNHNGALIEGLTLRFENGRIVEYSAKTGQQALKNIVEADEGSHYLGEVALVPVDSPISKMGRLFYNTLFDENASCHLAIGEAYPLVQGGQELPRSEWEKHGLNESIMHVDFMIGSPDLDIDAELKNGETVPIFRKGNWAAQV